jgi:hypothetical protein
MSNLKYNLNIETNDANGFKAINVSTNDTREIQRILSLAGILDGTTESQPTSTAIRAVIIPQPSSQENHDECCDDSGYCAGCGAAVEFCNCDDDITDEEYDETAEVDADGFEISTQGPLFGCVDEGRDSFDYGEVVIDEDGEEVDPETYMYRATNGEQRIVKGMQGDNPLISEEAIELHTKLLSEWSTFLSETADEIDDTDKEENISSGQLSPLTYAARSSFDRDPQRDQKPVTDGSRSPMSSVIRQSVAK